MADFDFLRWEPGSEFPFNALTVMIRSFKNPIFCKEIDSHSNLYCIVFYTRKLDEIKEDDWGVLAGSLFGNSFYEKFETERGRPFSGTVTEIKKYIKERKEEIEAELEAEKALEKLKPVIMGLDEAAHCLGVSKQVLCNWRVRRSDFPEPIAELAMGPIWKAEDIEIYYQQIKEKIS